MNAAGLGLTPSCGRVQHFFTLKYRQKYVKKIKKESCFFYRKVRVFSDHGQFLLCHGPYYNSVSKTNFDGEHTSLVFNCLRIQCRDYTKHNTETDTTAPRGHTAYTCATENPELGILLTGKQTNRKTCPEIFMIFLFACFSSNFSYC